jgi:hypothetical protein
VVLSSSSCAQVRALCSGERRRQSGLGGGSSVFRGGEEVGGARVCDLIVQGRRASRYEMACRFGRWTSVGGSD